MLIHDPIVLVVDDSDNDAVLMRIVFERAGFAEPLRFVPGGEEAIAYLGGEEGARNHHQFGMPTVVLLDLNMPRKDGFAVLEWIRAQPALHQLGVHILRASDRPEDITRAYDLGADSYLVKPSNLDGLTHLAKTLLAWLQLCHFAPLEPGGAARSSAHRGSVAPAPEPVPGPAPARITPEERMA